MLREIDERKLINAYARLIYEKESDITDDNVIKVNLINLFDWDILIQFIKDNGYEIEKISRTPLKEKRLENIKIVNDFLEAKEQHNIERFTNENYTVSGRGKTARPCIYNGKEYKSRQECIYKEGITKYQLYEYLKETNQL